MDFTVTVDGKPAAARYYTATASRARKEWQDIALFGVWPSKQTHTVVIALLNPASGAALYLDSLTLDAGVTRGASSGPVLPTASGANSATFTVGTGFPAAGDAP